MRPGILPFALLLSLAALGGCSGGSAATRRDAAAPAWIDMCPALAEYRTRNPNADATAAQRRHDDRLMMLGGATGEIPGITPGDLSIADQDAAVMLPETGDDDGCPSKDARNMARDYAYRYNEAMLATMGQRPGAQPVSIPTERPGS